MDVEEYKKAAAEQWSKSAEPWGRNAEVVDQMAERVTDRLLDTAALEPGDRVLELACGPAGVGLLAAAAVGPDGQVVLTDFVPPMVEEARKRAEGLGVANADFAVIDAQHMDLPDDDFDAVLCRFGYMLMPEPARALAETRRVLKPGGRVAFAVWSTPQDNPWASIPQQVLMALIDAPPPEPGTPSMFALGDPERLTGLLEDAGFADPSVEPVEATARYDSFEDWWGTMLQLSQPLRTAFENLPEPTKSELPEEVKRRSADYESEGGLEFPGAALVASASVP